MIRAFLPNVPLKTCLWMIAIALFCTPSFSQCPHLTLPVAQGFNNTTYPSCWVEQYVVGTSDIQFTSSSINPSTAPEEGSDFVWWNSYYYLYPAGNETRLVSPPITTTGTPSVDVNFYWYNENSTFYNSGNFLNEGVELQYSFDSINWVDVQFFARQDNSYASGSGGWKDKIVTLPLAAGNQPTVYIGWKFHSEYGDNCSLDNVHIQASPACAGGPSAVTAYNINTSGATISWTAAPTVPAGGYNYRVVLAGDSVNGVAIASGTTNSSTDSIVITGLNAITSYDVYVQSNCGGAAGVGYWIGPTTFTTPCAAFTSIPWTDGFESLGTNVGTDIFPPCWTGTPSGRWQTRNGPAGYPANMGPRTGSNYIVDYYNAMDTLFTPGFALTGGVTYEFYYYYETDGALGWDSLIAMYGQGQNAAGMTAQIGTPVYSPTNTNYVKFVAQVTPPTSGTYYFGLNLNSGYQGYVIAFDDFGIKVAPACGGLVSNENVTEITATSATLSWSAATPAPATGYNWELVATGDSVNGTVLFSGSTAAGVDSALVAGLSPSTSYDLYVQTNCGGVVGVGDWTGPQTFETPCAAITSLPWHEGFESLGGNTGTDKLPPCWLPTPNNRWTTSSVPLTFANITPRTGTNFLYDYYNANDTVFTPGFALTAGTQYEFYFYYLTDGNTGWDSIYAMYGPYQNQSSMTTRVGPVLIDSINTTYQKYSAIFTPTSSGTYYFGVKLSSTFGVNDIGFDDFGLQEVVPCPNPPQAGVIAGPNGVCSGNNATYTLTGYSPYTQLQWQVSSDSINFTDLTGSNQDYVTVNISSPTYLRVKILCADSSYTSVFSVYINSPVYCYCSDIGGSCGYYNIDTVSILNTNFYVADPTCRYNSQAAAYTQFPDTGSATTNIQRGGNYTISVYLQEATVSGAWIDFNQNGQYETTEFYPITSFASNGTVTFTVPDTAVLGVTGMRIRTNYSFSSINSNNACTHFFDGETFDFLLNIVDTICNFHPTVIDTVTNVTCYGGTNGSIALGIIGNNGPYTSLWSSGSQSNAITNLTAGRYADTIGFDYGCRYVWSVDTVAQPAKIIGREDSIDGVKCFGGTGSIFQTPVGGVPGYTNHWSSGDVSSSLINKASGVYVDTITDSRGCRVVIRDTLPGPASALSVVVDSVHSVSCNGLSDGAIYIITAGGTTPYNYNWSNSSTASNLTNLPKGFYTLNVTDHNGCTATASDSVTQPNPLIIRTDSVVNPKCANENDGSIYVTVSGGTLNYTYLWTGGVPTYNLYLVPAGVYTLSIVDTRNCTASISDTIVAPQPLTLSSNINNQIGGGALGSISTNAGGGVASYQYNWSNGATTSSIANLTAGVYVVTVTDQNGCTISQSDTVSLITSVTNIDGSVTSFNIYPNPSSGMFNALVELSHNVPVQIEVYSITGQQVPVAVSPGALNNIYQIDLTDQAGGVYMVKLIAGDNTVIRRITLVK